MCIRDSANADEVKQRAFDTQIGEGLMQAFEDAVCASPMWLDVCHKPLIVLTVMEG